MRAGGLFFLLLSCLALCTGVAAPRGLAGEVVVEGHVADADGKPLAYVEVTLLIGEERQTVLTDEKGRFRFEVAPEKRRNAVFLLRLPGHPVQRVPFAEFTAAGGKIVLAPEPAPMEEILVLGRNISQPFAPQRVGKIEVLINPAARADPLLAVASFQGATNVSNSADVELRGSAAGFSRVYYNDIPLYEVVRGTAVDQVTRGVSTINTSLIQEVELHPTNPPAFLANAAGGAVRLLPDDRATGQTTLVASLPAVSATFALASAKRRDHFVQFFLQGSELSGLTEVNPKLKDTIRSFRSASAGAGGRVDIDSRNTLYFLESFDYERGVYPFRIFNLRLENTSERWRAYNLASYERRLGGLRLKLDGALTLARNDNRLDGTRALTRNRYVYGALDLAGEGWDGLFRYRFGLSGEAFRFKAPATGEPAPAIPGLGGDLFPGRSRKAHYGAAYEYVTISPAKTLSLALGSRQYLFGSPEGDAVTREGSLSVQTPKGRHRFLFGAGRYVALNLPENPFFANIETLRARQYSIDYRLDLTRAQFGVGFFWKREREAVQRRRIKGIDAALKVSPTNDLVIDLTFARALPVRTVGQRRFRGGNHLPYLLRAAGTYYLSADTTINFSYITRKGLPFTDVIGAVRDPQTDRFLPIFSSELNARRLGRFETLDLSATTPFRIWPGAHDPLIFVAVSNLLDRRNEARPIWNADFSQESRTFFERRTFSFGLVYQF